MSLEGSLVLVRPDVNKNFYGVNLKPSEILSNPAHRPVAARPLYQALAEVLFCLIIYLEMLLQLHVLTCVACYTRCVVRRIQVLIQNPRTWHPPPQAVVLILWLTHPY